MLPLLGLGEKGSRGRAAAPPGDAGAENSPRESPGNAPLGVQVPPIPLSLCRDITSATAEPWTGCQSSTRLLLVDKEEVRRDLPAPEWHPSYCLGWKK